MNTFLQRHGTRFVMTLLYLITTGGLMFGSYVLALLGKLTADWVQLCSVMIGSLSLATVGYQASRGYTDAKRTEAGIEPKVPA